MRVRWPLARKAASWVAQPAVNGVRVGRETAECVCVWGAVFANDSLVLLAVLRSTLQIRCPCLYLQRLVVFGGNLSFAFNCFARTEPNAGMKGLNLLALS